MAREPKSSIRRSTRVILLIQSTAIVGMAILAVIALTRLGAATSGTSRWIRVAVPAASGAAVIALAATVWHAIVVRRMVIAPTERATDLVTDLSSGARDLTRRIPCTGSAEAAELARNLNRFVAAVHDIIYRTKGVTGESGRIGESLAASAEQISASVTEMAATMEEIRRNGDNLERETTGARSAIGEINALTEGILQRIEDQSAAVTESSAAVEQMVANIQQIGRAARQRQGVVTELEEEIVRGEANMRQTLDAMNAVSASADVVQELIRVINNVANQTNILAMNAAIEAAHAGDAGRGFAVVAAEIRTLAETTATNARNIGTNVTQILDSIHGAASLTEGTGAAITAMTGRMREVAESMAHISAGLDEITTGTEEVTRALSSMVDISTDVRQRGEDIASRTASVDAAVATVADLTTQNSSALAESATGIREVQGAVSEVAGLGERNTQYIRMVDAEISGFRTMDVSSLRSVDGQPLIRWEKNLTTIPPRPEDPSAYPETDARHWWDLEYAGWNVSKTNMPRSDADGAAGKRIVALLPRAGHPYYQAVKRGMEKMAAAFEIALEIVESDWDSDEQERQVNNAAASNPDLIVLAPKDVERARPWFVELNRRGIPVVASIIQPHEDSFRYILCYTGNDEWGSLRELAPVFANALDRSGGYACVQHRADSTFFASRTYPLVTELSRIAPEMRLLDAQSGNQDPVRIKQLVLGWIDRFGSELRGIATSDDHRSLTGVVEAVESAGRDDIVIVAPGNSATGMEFVKRGRVHAITVKSAETEGALPIETAIEYFNGLEVPPIKYVPRGIITAATVEDYLPAQW